MDLLARAKQNISHVRPRNPFPDPLLLTIVLKTTSEERIGQVSADGERGAAHARKGTVVEIEGGKVGSGGGKSPFVLLLKKATDLVLQPFQSLQVSALLEGVSSIQTVQVLTLMAKTSYAIPLVGQSSCHCPLRYNFCTKADLISALQVHLLKPCCISSDCHVSSLLVCPTNKPNM